MDFKAYKEMTKSWFAGKKQGIFLWTSKTFAYIKIRGDFCCAYYFLRLKNHFRNFVFYRLPPQLFKIFSVLYFIFLFVLSYKLATPLLGNLITKDGVTFFTSLGAMLGGVLAIVFSVSTLLMQNAAQYSSAGFYDTLAKDRKQRAIFWVIVFMALGYFWLALLFSSENTLSHVQFVNNIAKISIVSLGFAFWLLYVLYIQIYSRMQPMSNLVIIKRESIKQLKKISKYANEAAAVTVKESRLTKEASLEMALAVSFQKLQPALGDVKNKLDYLFDYHDKLVSLNERKMALAALNTIYQIVSYYFQLRATSSIILPAPEFFLVGVSDSQNFLTPILENLVSKGEAYMKANDGVGITQIINIFENLIKLSSQIKYISKRQTENSIFAQCRGYLDQLMDSAIKHDNMEALFQGSRVYQQVGLVAIQRNLQYELEAIYTILNKMASFAIIKKYDIVWGKITETYPILLGSLVVSDFLSHEIYVKSLIQSFQAVVLFAYVGLQSRNLSTNFTTTTQLITPFKTIQEILFNLVRAAEKTEGDKKRANLQSAFLTLAEELRSSLRFFSENIKNADSLLAGTFGEVIADIGCLLLELSTREKWQDSKREILKMVSWYAHQPGWFIHYAEKIDSNRSFDSFVEAVTKIGLKALQVGEDGIAQQAIKSLAGFASDMITKEQVPKYGYTEPRIMERACFVGILALKLKKQKIVDALKVQIESFENKYREFWFKDVTTPEILTSPQRDQLQVEIIGLRDTVQKSEYDLNGRSGILDLSEDRLIEEIDAVDVDRFTFEIWQFFEAGSPFEEELNLKLARTKLVNFLRKHSQNFNNSKT